MTIACHLCLLQPRFLFRYNNEQSTKAVSEIKTSVCTGTRGGSETSLNTVVHENIEVYEPVCKIFLKFP